jgi:hypothetical protein
MGFFYMRNRLRALPNIENASLSLIQGKGRCISLQYTDPFPESGPEKHFQGSGMRAIDSSNRKTPTGDIFDHIAKKKKEMISIGVILCGESIAHIPAA